VLCVLWALRARREDRRFRRLLAPVAFVVAAPVVFAGSLGFSIPVLLLVIALLVVDVSLRSAVVGSVILTVIGLALHLPDWVNALSNGLAIGVLLCVGIVLGMALGAYDDALASARRTLAERDRVTDELRDSLERLRRKHAVEKELVLADERARSARELHDGLGHRLTLTSIGLEYAERMREKDPEAAWEEVGNVRSIVIRALTEMRTWVRALHPVRDADATGVQAFEAIAESFRGTGLEVEVSGEAELAPGPETALVLYRAVQEGLTNALRHGGAHYAGIHLAPTPGAGVVLSVRSDLDDEASGRLPDGPPSHGFGLRGLTERAEELGGSVRAERTGDEFVLEVTL